MIYAVLVLFASCTWQRNVIIVGFIIISDSKNGIQKQTKREACGEMAPEMMLDITTIEQQQQQQQQHYWLLLETRDYELLSLQLGSQAGGSAKTSEDNAKRSQLPVAAARASEDDRTGGGACRWITKTVIASFGGAFIYSGLDCPQPRLLTAVYSSLDRNRHVQSYSSRWSMGDDEIAQDCIWDYLDEGDDDDDKPRTETDRIARNTSVLYKGGFRTLSV
ncbi:hypothetical protein CIB48_g3913 [Xylaria polymorpha]|nr:hypothetical protein CIB48_g3913 [Xylaria polymorpha]